MDAQWQQVDFASPRVCMAGWLRLSLVVLEMEDVNLLPDPRKEEETGRGERDWTGSETGETIGIKASKAKADRFIFLGSIDFFSISAQRPAARPGPPPDQHVRLLHLFF